MELQLVREPFQSDMIGKDNFRSVEERCDPCAVP